MEAQKQYKCKWVEDRMEEQLKFQTYPNFYQLFLSYKLIFTKVLRKQDYGFYMS